jgi:hypothetical protein
LRNEDQIEEEAPGDTAMIRALLFAGLAAAAALSVVAACKPAAAATGWVLDPGSAGNCFSSDLRGDGERQARSIWPGSKVIYRSGQFEGMHILQAIVLQGGALRAIMVQTDDEATCKHGWNVLHRLTQAENAIYQQKPAALGWR